MARRSGVDNFGIMLPKLKKATRPKPAPQSPAQESPAPEPSTPKLPAAEQSTPKPQAAAEESQAPVVRPPAQEPEPEPAVGAEAEAGAEAESCSAYPPLPPDPVYPPLPEFEPSRPPLARDPIMKLITPEVTCDCEFGQAHDPETGEEWHVVAWVSFTNNRGQVIYDTAVHHEDKPGIVKKLHIAKMKDGKLWSEFGTLWPDLKEENGAQAFEKVCNDIRKIVKASKILAGHALINDMSKFPDWVWEGVATRDIQLFEPYREHARYQGGRRLPRLGDLAKNLLGDEVWKNGHTSVDDARVTAALYMLNKEAIDDAQREGYVVENDLRGEFGSLDPNRTDTEEGAYARLRREQKHEILWENQILIESADAVPRGKEGITPFRYATDLWVAGVDELKRGLASSSQTEKLGGLSLTSGNHARNLSWSSDDTWPSSNGPAGFSMTSGRSSPTSWSTCSSSRTSTSEQSSLLTRSLRKLDMSEEDWDGKLLVDDIGTKPVVSFPDGRASPDDDALGVLPWCIDSAWFDHAWWLSDTYKRPGRKCECRNGHTWDCSGWGAMDIIEAVGREPLEGMPVAKVLGSTDWPTVVEAHQ